MFYDYRVATLPKSYLTVIVITKQSLKSYIAYYRQFSTNIKQIKIMKFILVLLSQNFGKAINSYYITFLQNDIMEK